MAVLATLLPAAGCRNNKTVPLLSAEARYQEAERQLISGDLLAAQRTAEAALQAVMEPAWQARLRVELARSFLYRGENQRVAETLRQPFPAGSAPDEEIRRELLLAVAQRRLGNAAGSGQALLRAVALRPTGGLMAELQGTQGGVALERGELAEAQQLFQTALEEDQRDRNTFHEASMWINLGVVSLRLEHYEDALLRFRQASQLAERMGARQLAEKALGNLARTYYRTGDYPRSLQSAEAAAKEAAAIGATIDELYLFKTAGNTRFAQGDLPGARASFQRALGLAQGLKNSEQMVAAEVELAYVLLKQSPGEAEGHIAEAKRLAALGEDRSEELEPLLLEALLRKQQGRVEEAEGLLLKLVAQAETSPSFQWEAEDTLATLYASAGRAAPAERWFRQAIATFHSQRLSLRSLELELPFLEGGSDLYLNYVDFLVASGRTAEALQVLDGSRAETLAEGLGKAARGGVPGSVSADPRAVARRLHSTLLVYCLRPGETYLWAIDGQREQLFRLPGRGALLPLVARHTAAILGSKDLLAQPETGRALYDALVAPAQALLPLGAHVVLVADDVLTGLNFETLIPPGLEPHYWIEDVTVTNARSVRLLGAPAGRGSPSLLLLGDPVYNSGEYAPLPNAAAEMAGVAGHFAEGARRVVSGSAATPAAYAGAEPGRFRFVHFTAHATASETTPLDSAILLSPGAGGAKLYASEILRQPLGAELVTLSSCYGTGTRSYSGEGLVGLVWAFLRAGAHEVIGALWEVSDVSTPPLMDALYGELLRGEAPEVALRRGKLALLHGGGVFRKPLYWASFQLYAGR